MQKQFFFLSPVEVVKVTSQNLEEVAEWCGGKIATAESRRTPGKMDPYVWVPTPKGSNISWAFPGMFITKRIVVTMKNELRTTYSVFRKDYFDKNYFDAPLQAVDQTWERYYKEQKEEKAVMKDEPVEEKPAPIINIFMDPAKASVSPAEMAEIVKEKVQKTQLG